MSKKERQYFAIIGFITVLALGILYYFFGKLIIDFVLSVVAVLLHWMIGATIALAGLGFLVFFFLSDKQIEWLTDDSKRTAREKAEKEVIDAYINERVAQRKREENNNKEV